LHVCRKVRRVEREEWERIKVRMCGKAVWSITTDGDAEAEHEVENGAKLAGESAAGFEVELEIAAVSSMTATWVCGGVSGGKSQ